MGSVQSQARHALKGASFDAIFDVVGVLKMRTTLNLDDELVAKAAAYTGLTEKSAIVREALKSLIAREAGRRLAALGGTMPDLKDIPRRRSDPE
jgi:Arc/MetJ family transcription regulator